MKFTEPRPFADPDVAARKLIELARPHSCLPYAEGRTARALKWSSTKTRTADERFACCRLASISLISSANVMPRSLASSFTLLQNGCSRLTLVLWPRTTIDRLTTGDFI